MDCRALGLAVSERERSLAGQQRNPNPKSRDSYGPTASWERLKLRASLLRRLRSFFEARDFLEVETPLLSADTVIDRHLDPIPVILFDDPARPEVGPRKWLQTSPEFAMKRLLAAGAEKIFQENSYYYLPKSVQAFPIPILRSR